MNADRFDLCLISAKRFSKAFKAKVLQAVRLGRNDALDGAKSVLSGLQMAGWQTLERFSGRSNRIGHAQQPPAMVQSDVAGDRSRRAALVHWRMSFDTPVGG